MRPIRGVFPGSFNPPTVAHLAIADAARRQCGLDRLDLALSRVTLGKEEMSPTAETRAAALALVLPITPPTARPGAPTGATLRAVVTEACLLVDIAAGYDWLVLGADKWEQVRDPGWYGQSEALRDEALRRLPRLALVPRPPVRLPIELAPAGSLILDLEPWLADVSSTAVRAGAERWIAPRR